MTGRVRRAVRRKIIVRGPKDVHRVALTFDDGPHPEVTPRLLEVLARHGAHATFFLLGSRVLCWPKLAVEIAEAGHAIGSHGHAHRKDWWRSARTLGEDLDRAEEVIGGLLPEPKLFRPPFGVLSPGWFVAARDRGYTCVLWNVASRDWRDSDAGRVAERVIRRLAPGALVLLHECRAQTGEGYAHTIEAVDRCLASAEERELEAVTVAEFLRSA